MAENKIETGAPEAAQQMSGAARTAAAAADAFTRVVSCIDGYDPNALKVDKAREAIRACLTPIASTERVAARAALGRVLGADVISTLDVPAHDNSAMDGYALRHADLKAKGDTELRLAGSAYAGRQFAGKLGKGECVRIMTGAVMPRGTDTVVMQEIVQAEGDRIRIPAGQKNRPEPPPRRRGPGTQASRCSRPGSCSARPTLGLIASLGLAEVTVLPAPARGFLLHRRRTAPRSARR